MCTQLTCTSAQTSRGRGLNGAGPFPIECISGRQAAAKTNYHIHECFLSYLTDIMFGGVGNVI